MNLIDTAPKDGTIIEVFHEKYGWHTMAWSPKRKRWEGKAFTPMGMRNTWWDEEAEQPTHWEPIQTEVIAA